MKIMLTFLFLSFFWQQSSNSSLFKNKIWYCVKYSSGGTMHGIERFSPKFKFSYDFRNRENESGNHYSYSTSDMGTSYTGEWSFAEGVLTMTPQSYSGQPRVKYDVIIKDQNNFLILKTRFGDSYYMVSSN